MYSILQIVCITLNLTSAAQLRCFDNEYTVITSIKDIVTAMLGHGKPDFHTEQKANHISHSSAGLHNFINVFNVKMVYHNMKQMHTSIIGDLASVQMVYL